MYHIQQSEAVHSGGGGLNSGGGGGGLKEGGGGRGVLVDRFRFSAGFVSEYFATFSTYVFVICSRTTVDVGTFVIEYFFSPSERV